MGEGQLLAAATLIAVVAAAVPATGVAQGVAYRERWGYLHLEERRAELWRECARRSDSDRAAVEALLAAPDDGLPFRPVARALAHLRAVDCDDAFLLRTTMGMFVLPEVCDPEGANEICRSVALSACLPFTAALPGKVALDFRVRDVAGKVVWSAEVADKTELKDLRMGTTGVQVPGAALADGTYTAELQVVIDGVQAPASAPLRTWPFHVLRGYQKRTEAAQAAAKAQLDSLPPGERAWLAGALQPVVRAYYGEAFVARSAAVAELQHLELVLANLAAKRPAAHGVDGERLLAFAGTGTDASLPPLQCVLRRGPDTATGFVVMVAGTPSYDGVSLRPAAPATREPGWLAREFADFGPADGLHVAFLESPGGGRDYAGALRTALPLLQSMLPAAAKKPWLVAEREAAAIAAFRLADLRPLLSGLVLVGSGAVAAPMLQQLGDFPVRAVRQAGPGEANLVRMLDWVAVQQAGTWQGDVAWLGAERSAWQFGLAAPAPALRAFLRARAAK
ncbi:MAG: hypothetical protein JNK15_11950 [Planctomycetes bacterium]|nr:hypothetical protein [Planctomycetota bacterium]